jgi:hypothetical protein
MLYLIYETKSAAIDRADEEGKYIGFDYWIEDNGQGTRWLTYPAETADYKWALDVTDYNLTPEEQEATVDSYVPLPEPPEEI